MEFKNSQHTQAKPWELFHSEFQAIMNLQIIQELNCMYSYFEISKSNQD